MDNLSLFANDVRTEWNACHGAFYQVDESDFLFVLREQRWLLFEKEIWDGTPVLLAKASKLGASVGISAQARWVSLHGRVNDPPAFAAEALRSGKASGTRRLFFGGHDFHCIAGVPSEDRELSEALSKEGFYGPEAIDLAGPFCEPRLEQFEKEESAKAIAEGWRLDCVNERSKGALLDFLKEHFPGRWWREFLFSVEQGLPSIWFLLLDSSGTVRGFSRASTRRVSQLPAGLRLPAASGRDRRPSDGALGPLGISAENRGLGLGRKLLALSLAALRDQGAEELCVDWVSSSGFYRPLGLPEVRRMRCFRKDFQ